MRFIELKKELGNKHSVKEIKSVVDKIKPKEVSSAIRNKRTIVDLIKSKLKVRS